MSQPVQKDINYEEIISEHIRRRKNLTDEYDQQTGEGSPIPHFKCMAMQ